MANIFAPTKPEDTLSDSTYNKTKQEGRKDPERKQIALERPDYTKSLLGTIDLVLAYLKGFAIGFFIVFVFYKLIIPSVVLGILYGLYSVSTANDKAIARRKLALRRQFFDMLESLSVSLRSGIPVNNALNNARDDIKMLYTENSDIYIEICIMLAMFQSNIKLSDALDDFAKRSGLEDIASFASIYRTTENKASAASEIIRHTQTIIRDKMEVEMEIETLMTAAKNQLIVMAFMPIVILLIMGYMGTGFLDGLYTSAFGRVAATIGLIIYISAIAWGNKISSIRL